LKLGNTGIGDTALSVIGQCTILTHLQLDHTNITNKGLEHLQSLSRLQSLNLAGTKVTAAGIKILKNLKELEFLYLYQTNVDRKDWEELKKTFPKIAIDSGGYVVPALVTDTMIVKPQKNK
jgi:Leucine-rich repeat (LRR) protein